YINYALPGNPATDPEVQSGYFIPLKLKGGYLSTLQNQNRYIARYRFSGDFYVDPEHENANEYYHKLEGGIEHVFRNHGLIEDTLYAGAFLKYKKDVYFDRDTGDDQRSSVTGEDISNRYSYNSYGAEFEYKQRTTPVQFKVFGKYEKRDYEDPDVIAELDKTYYELGGEVEFDVAEPSELSFGYTYGVMDYDDKLARDSDGRLFASNDKLKYTYHEYEASLRNRLTDEVVVYLDYRYKTRTDD
ncbi:MAG: hypothetical protein GWN61_15475, partial [candidate division Zixibacteria bacterium]|nr:hypothetical protein [candidate division Zixibacteria bacterium]NIW45565.1 hypothetical protein [Gammaproteobacteria bacterium]NIX01346.1 hypothetical protein [Phycisphaerae bacterium]NIR65637.1 hypothetical protein [candidate division Zixibacteria bacterium]NIS47332.1 hypothetical protein [candidate division Zixibacteria bacterium]